MWSELSVSTSLTLSKLFNLCSRFNFVNSSLQDKGRIKNIIVSGGNLYLKTTVRTENRGPVWDKPVPDLGLCFCHNFFLFCWMTLVAFGEFIFQKLVTNPLFGWKLFVVQQDTFYLHKDHEQNNLKKNRVNISLISPSETGKSQLIYNWLEIGSFQPKFDKNYFIYQHYQPATSRCYAKRNWKSWFCSRCKLWMYTLGKKQLYNVLVDLRRFMWRDLQMKSVCWYCYCWKTSWIDHYLHQTQLVSSKQSWTRRWVPEHAHCSLQISP